MIAKGRASSGITAEDVRRVAAARHALRTYEPYGPSRRRAGQVKDRLVAQVQSLGTTTEAAPRNRSVAAR